jgi:hypothetical protein
MQEMAFLAKSVESTDAWNPQYLSPKRLKSRPLYANEMQLVAE